MTNNKDILTTSKWLNLDEINKNLEGVEYIFMAAPTPQSNPRLPIHFTIYLNTTDDFTDEISNMVFNKFCKDYEIFKVNDMIKGLHKVAFSVNNQETYMPMLILDNSDIESELTTKKMYVYDFEGNAKGFKECKTESKTGWTYSYEKDNS